MFLPDQGENRPENRSRKPAFAVCCEGTIAIVLNVLLEVLLRIREAFRCSSEFHIHGRSIRSCDCHSPISAKALERSADFIQALDKGFTALRIDIESNRFALRRQDHTFNKVNR